MKTIFITGGARSGKSSFALHKAEQLHGKKVYIATAEPRDGEMKERIEYHKDERGREWDTVEEAFDLSGVLERIKAQYGVILIDCLTLWLSNLMMNNKLTSPDSPGKGDLRGDIVSAGIKTEISRFVDRLKELNSSADLHLFIVSNEVGMGIVPGNKIARRFRDLAGRMNQKVAA
ncbi:MAG TPA: bifunctional adenosylcobinamide kinase/adenosylcobinamide-phosphate guanylyltransferase, partial [Nitrospirae bacterium]|nr:bifunctional adenosylcobinamide kinase/adenosylcobinamide-phosphate guanylyltransferase [Nitrospirota bacterium]